MWGISSWLLQQRAAASPELQCGVAPLSPTPDLGHRVAPLSSACAPVTAKAFDCVDHNKLWKILKEMGILDHLNCLLRNQLELDMEQ